MPERGFDTGYWTDSFVRKLSPEGKLLYIYLWANDHCNQAGTYEIDIEIMAFETKLSEECLPELLQELHPKVKWLRDQNIIWVKNFVARQAKSPKFLIAAAKCLKKLNNNGLAKEVVVYNLERHGISIPYPYDIDSVTIPPASVSVSRPKSEREEVVKEKGEPTITSESIPPSESELEESLSEGDRKVISTWHSVKGFKMSLSDASELVARLRAEFPDIDILAESKKWAARKLSEPLTKTSRSSAQIWNFMCKAREFAQERRGKGAYPISSQGHRPGQTPTEEQIDQQEKERGLR